MDRLEHSGDRDRVAVEDEIGRRTAGWDRQISASGPQYRGPGAAANGPLHHYTFEVYALDTKVDVAPSANAQPMTAALETRAAVMKAMQAHVLGKAWASACSERP